MRSTLGVRRNGYNTQPAMTKDFLPHLRAACATVRHQADASQEAVARIEGVAASNISTFERGKSGWPLNPDARVAAYAKACGTTPVALWQDALGRYETASKRRRHSA